MPTTRRHESDPTVEGLQEMQISNLWYSYCRQYGLARCLHDCEAGKKRKIRQKTSCQGIWVGSNKPHVERFQREFLTWLSYSNGPKTHPASYELEDVCGEEHRKEHFPKLLLHLAQHFWKTLVQESLMCLRQWRFENPPSGWRIPKREWTGWKRAILLPVYCDLQFHSL